MNDLAYVIKQSKLSGYADDTQISYADKDPAKVEVINFELAKIVVSGAKKTKCKEISLSTKQS